MKNRSRTFEFKYVATTSTIKSPPPNNSCMDELKLKLFIRIVRLWKKVKTKVYRIEGGHSQRFVLALPASVHPQSRDVTQLFLGVILLITLDIMLMLDAHLSWCGRVLEKYSNCCASLEFEHFQRREQSLCQLGHTTLIKCGVVILILRECYRNTVILILIECYRNTVIKIFLRRWQRRRFFLKLPNLLIIFENSSFIISNLIDQIYKFSVH